jgi:uncharacterized protein
MLKSPLLLRSFLFALGVVLLLVFGIVQTRLADHFDPAGSVFPTHAVAQGRMWKLEIANTSPLRSLGLGEREHLPGGHGMLFLFDAAERYGFWMKGMRFPLDIIFLVRGKIVFIERGIQPSDQRTIVPPVPSDQVLEVNAGEAAGLSVGDHMWYWRAF